MKRVIFTLLYDSGGFMLSRNFRLQHVGSVDWLFNSYDFAHVSHGLDELMVLDVSRRQRDPERFADQIQYISGLCFIPMTVGGGIRSFEVAQKLIRSGADKLLLNSAFHADPALCRRLSAHFGRQCIVAGVDYRFAGKERRVTIENGSKEIDVGLSRWTELVQEQGAGEILFQSIDQDGTGMGLDLAVVDELERAPEVPCIILGGVGTAAHIIAGLKHRTIDAVATANLFNFIGSAFLDARRSIAEAGVEIPQWDATNDYASLRGRFARPVEARGV